MTDPFEGKSEVAQLLRQIELEYQAAQRCFTEFSAVARHQTITARMENMQHCHAQLQKIVGEHEAIKLVVETLERA